MKKSLCAVALLTLFTHITINATTIGELVRTECLRWQPEVLKGHSAIMGTIADEQFQENPSNPLVTLDFASIRRNREEISTIIKEQISTLFGVFFSIQTKPEETADAFLAANRFSTSDIQSHLLRFHQALRQSLLVRDPIFPVLCIEHQSFVGQLAESPLKTFLLTALGLANTDNAYPSVQTLLTNCLSGNSIATNYALGTERIPQTWLQQSYSELSRTAVQTTTALNLVQRLAATGSQYMDYILMRAIFIDDLTSDDQKVALYDAYNTTAARDYRTFIQYIDLCKSIRQKKITNLSQAREAWLNLFTNGGILPLSQSILFRHLFEHTENTWLFGYKEALLSHLNITTSAPSRLSIMCTLCDHYPSQETAEAYMLYYLYQAPEKQRASAAEKLAEIERVAQLAPAVKTLYVNALSKYDNPVMSLGFSAKTPIERQEMLADLAQFDQSEYARETLTQANIGAFNGASFDLLRRHFGYKDIQDIKRSERTQRDYQTLTQMRFAQIFEYGLSGCKYAQKALCTPDATTKETLLTFLMRLNESTGVTHYGNDFALFSSNAHRLLNHAFTFINTINGHNDLRAGSVNFSNEVQIRIMKLERFKFPQEATK